MIFKSRTFEHSYAELISKLLNYGSKVGNTLETCNACFIVGKPDPTSITVPYRKISEDYANAELKWCWSADNKCSTIGKHAKMWLSLSDNGKTNNSAYGYILFKKYHFDQLQQVIEVLKSDPTSRRAVLNISDPKIDRLNTKDMQCTIAVQFMIRSGELRTTVYMRSNDVCFGLPYDYIFFISLADYVAKALNIPLGKYTHYATSMHMYEKDKDKFDRQSIMTMPLQFDIIRKENYHAGPARVEKKK